jgi:uncharacterized protein YecT (DUF1311 family)
LNQTFTRVRGRQHDTFDDGIGLIHAVRRGSVVVDLVVCDIILPLVVSLLEARWAEFCLSSLVMTALAYQCMACEARGQQPASSPAPAPPMVVEPPPSSNPCAKPESEEALMACEHREHDRAEASIHRLESALHELYAKEPELLAAFDAAQAKWREFRDAECALRTFDSRDGTAFESYWLDCLRTLALERAARLEYMHENP